MVPGGYRAGFAQEAVGVDGIAAVAGVNDFASHLALQHDDQAIENLGHAAAAQDAFNDKIGQLVAYQRVWLKRRRGACRFC
jgi:hypothetical protein